MDPELERHYKTQLARKSDSLAIEGQQKVQQVETAIARSGMVSGVGLAHLLGTYCEYSLRLPTVALLESFEDSRRALAAEPADADYDGILNQAAELMNSRVAGGQQFARDRLSRHGIPIDWSSMVDQVASRVMADFRRAIELKKIEARNRSRASVKASDKVFVVHGHDHQTRNEVAGFLVSIGLNPIILGEEPAKGRTLIEKLEQEGDVSYAVILLTGDDLGTEESRPSDLRPRARQNVILELGYFVGRYGRAKVIPLYEAGVEIPADYHGVEYVPLSGEWKIRLANELKAAGLPVLLNETT